MSVPDMSEPDWMVDPGTPILRASAAEIGDPVSTQNVKAIIRRKPKN